MKINFREIDKSNYNECINLRVADNQVNYVASNSFSLVQAFYEEDLYPLGIYDNETMVGFILYDYDKELEGWSFSRFMIDKDYQNKGYGKVALEKFLKFFHDKYEAKSLYTSVEIDNEVAINLYESFGFKRKEYFEYTVRDITYKEYRMLKEEW